MPVMPRQSPAGGGGAGGGAGGALNGSQCGGCHLELLMPQVARQEAPLVTQGPGSWGSPAWAWGSQGREDRRRKEGG